MAKDTAEQKTETKAVTPEQIEQEQAKASVTVPQAMTKGIQHLTLPELVGQITTKILTALESPDQGAKGAVVADGRRDLRVWYESQSVEHRQEIAKKSRKTIENFKSVAEQLWSDIGLLVAQDL